MFKPESGECSFATAERTQKFPMGQFPEVSSVSKPPHTTTKHKRGGIHEFARVLANTSCRAAAHLV